MVTYRICKNCKAKMILTIVKNKGNLTYYPLDRLNYCDECWKLKIRGKIK